MNIIFLHGFASSGKGTKATFLGERLGDIPEVDYRTFEYTPTPRDFEFLTITGSINRLRQFVLDHDLEPFVLVGSSFGALVGMNYAWRFGGVEKALLLAPALSYASIAPVLDPKDEWQSTGVVQVMHYAFDRSLPLRYELEIDGKLFGEAPPPSGPVTIIHGIGDEVVPVEESRRYTAAHPDLVELVEVDASHDLNAHLEVIWEELTAIMGR